MSEPKLYLETLCEHGRMESHGTMKGARGEELSAPGHICEGGERYEVTVSHMLSTVRAGVESGTIKGATEKRHAPDGHVPSIRYSDACSKDCRFVDVLVIPVSDGGSET